jgi:hypothetical protein
LDKRRKRAVASNVEKEEQELVYNQPHLKEEEEGGRRRRLVVPNKLVKGVDGKKKLSDEGNPRKVEGRTREDPETYFPKNNGIRQLLFIRMR